MDDRSTAVVYHPFLTGTGNRNSDDVTQVSVEEGSARKGVGYKAIMSPLDHWMEHVTDRQTDRRTDTRRQHMYRASVALHGNWTYRIVTGLALGYQVVVLLTIL